MVQLCWYETIFNHFCIVSIFVFDVYSLLLLLLLLLFCLSQYCYFPGQDAFSGIGSGLLALKKVGLVIKKVIHIEWDKIATHVYRCNHDRNYASSANFADDDGIEHVYYNCFDWFATNLEVVLNEHNSKFSIICIVLCCFRVVVIIFYSKESNMNTWQ